MVLYPVGIAALVKNEADRTRLIGSTLNFRWFHMSLTRDQAENMLMRAPYDGSFLVRKKETTERNQEAFAISFKYVQ